MLFLIKASSLSGMLEPSKSLVYNRNYKFAVTEKDGFPVSGSHSQDILRVPSLRSQQIHICCFTKVTWL